MDGDRRLAVQWRRREVLAGTLALGVGWILTRHAEAADNALDISGDDGKPLPNFRLPVELSPSSLPGIIWVGSESPDVTFIEFFDYNCPFCKVASPDLDALMAMDKGFRLGLVNNPIISLASIQAAKVQQGVLKLYGPQRAYAFHKALFARRGLHDGAAALQTAAALGLNQTDLEGASDGGDVGSVLKRQAKASEALGFAATPSFDLNGIGVLGYPGPKAMANMVSAVRTCEKPVC